ncbi:MAG: thiamine-phosphate kinase [Pseudomonadota bacterium]
MSASEFDLINRYFAALGKGPAVRLGVGDDAALLALPADYELVVSVDTLVEAVHFPAEAFPEEIAYRAVSVAASDLAAMGAEPLGMTLSLTLPEADDFWLHSFSEGLAGAANDLSLPLIGGDTTRGPLTIAVQVLGCVPAGSALTRQGARCGDRLCVSGPLGDGAAALALQQDQLVVPAEQGEYLWQRFYRPDIPLELGQQLRGLASAAIDISDGLLADAGHIAAASGVAIHIDPERIPLSTALATMVDRQRALGWALTGGDDYQLCFTLPGDAVPPAGCSTLGEVREGAGVHCPVTIDKPAGYQHF